jgi:hypothetical protein
MRHAVSVLAVLLPLLAGCDRRSTVKNEKTLSWFYKPIERPVGELQTAAFTIPKIEENPKDGWGYLVFPPVEGQPVRLLIGPMSPFRGMLALFPRKLRYTILLTKWENDYSPGKFSWEPEIATVEDQGMILYDTSICPLHHTQQHMRRGLVEISYGAPDLKFMRDMEREFPGGPGFVTGFGCVPGSQKVKFDYCCDACIAAFKKWEYKRLRD